MVLKLYQKGKHWIWIWNQYLIKRKDKKALAISARVFGIHMANRVFLVDPEDLSVKMCQTKPLHNEDRVFLISTKLDYPEFTGKVHNFLDGKTTFCQINDATDIIALILAECVNEEDVYFIGGRMDRYYRECKDEIIEKGHKIGKNRSFGVAKTTLRGKEMQQSLTDFMGDMAIALNAPPKKYSHITVEGSSLPGEKESVESELDVKQNHEEVVKSSDVTISSPKENALGATKSKIKDLSRNETRKNCDKHKRKSEEEKDQKIEDIINALEAEIFGNQSFSEESITCDTRVSDAKAAVTFALFERLSRHICELTRKSFDQEQCYRFVLLLRKTETPEEFEESWKTVFSDPSFRILVDTYWILRNEATYYHKICTVLYEEDTWTS